MRLIRGLSRKSSPAHSSTNSNTSPHQYTLLIQGGIDQDRCKFYSDSRAFEGTKFPCGELYPLRAPSPAQPVIFFSFPDHSRKKEGNKKKDFPNRRRRIKGLIDMISPFESCTRMRIPNPQSPAESADCKLVNLHRHRPDSILGGSGRSR